MPADTAAPVPGPDCGPPARGLVGVEPVVGVAKPDPIVVADARRAPVRRRHGGRRRARRVPARRHHRAHRPQRRRQDHVLQRAHLLRPAPGRGMVVQRSSRSRASRPTWSPAAACVRTFQLTKVLTKLTVIENMRLGATDQRGETFLTVAVPSGWTGQERENTERADDLLVRFKMDHMREQFAGSAVRRSAQAARDGPSPDDRPRADHARRADGGREPGAQAVAARAREVAAGRGPHR